MDDFQAKSNSFLSWFRSQPNSSFDSRLQLTDLRSRNAGRGIIATQPIPAETSLFSIPRSSVISVSNSRLSKQLPQIFSTLETSAENKDVEMTDDGGGNDDRAPKEAEDEELQMPDPWLDLIFVMMYEYLQGHASPWKQYFEVLPQEFDTLMFWTPSELSELQASAIKDKIGKASADEMFVSKVLPVVRANEDVFYGEGVARLADDEILTLAHRMGSLIMAYAFDLESADDDDDDDDEDDEEGEGWVQDKDGTVAMGMVPMADMLNADAEFNAHLHHGEDALTMTSLRDIAAGDEVLNYYGPLPNCDLLRRYGYTSAKHSRYDVVEIPWSAVAGVIGEKFAGRELGKLDDADADESFVLERESGEPDDTGANAFPAAFSAFPDDLEEQVNAVVAPALGVDLAAPSKPQRKQLKTAFLEIVDAVISKRLREYGTSAVQDAEVARTAEGRRKMAVDVRLGEKKLLAEARDIIPGLLEKHRPVDEDDGQGRAKRQRRG